MTTTPLIDWDVTPEAWDAAVAACPRATFFHARGWYEANAVLGYRPMPARFRFPDGATAFLPMAVRPAFKGLVTEAHAGIESGYGGLVAPRPLTPAQVEAAYAAVLARFGDLHATASPFEGYRNVPAAGEAREYATQVLPIEAPEAQRARMSSSRAKHCKRAAKAGFRLEVVEAPGPDDVPRFYPLYARRAAHWDYAKWARDEAWFRGLFAAAGPALVLFLAYRGDALAGFRVLGLGGPAVMDLFLATDPAHEPAHVGPYLVAEPLAWCHAKGYAAFDFQASGRLEGVRAYKASFGAEPLPYPAVSCRSWRARSLMTLRGRQGSLSPSP